MPVKPEPTEETKDPTSPLKETDEAIKSNSPKLVVVTEETGEEKTEEKPVEETKAEANLTPTTETFPDSGEPVRGKRAVLPVFAIFLLIGLIASSVFFWKKTSIKTPNTVVLPTTSPAVVISPTPQASSSAELDKGVFKIQILNASGIPGAAAQAKSLLESKGYKAVETGNADSYDFEQTEISIKENKKEYLKILTADIAEKYKPSENSPLLDNGNEFDAIVRLGKE